jgi:hypothetical protein
MNDDAEPKRERHLVQRESGLAAELRRIRRRCSSLPILDPRPPDEIIAFDRTGGGVFADEDDQT